jgi:hypothetical protein
MLQAGRSLTRDPTSWINVFSLSNSSSRTRPWSLLSLYQKWVPEEEKSCFRRVERGPCVPPSVSGLSRQCEILNILQPYRPPRPVTGIALLYLHDQQLASEQRYCYFRRLREKHHAHWLGYGLENWTSILGGNHIIFFTTASRPALRPSQSSV